MKRWRKHVFVVLGVALALFLFSQSRYASWPFGPKWVRVVRSGGEPVHGAMLALERPGEDEPDFAERTSTPSGWLGIPRDRLRSGQEMFVIAPGCGLVRGQLPLLYKIELPPAVPVRLRVEGDFELPVAPWSLSVHLTPEGVHQRYEFAFRSAVVPSDYWLLDEMDRLARFFELDIDPTTRSVDLLVPHAGRWRVEWSVVFTERRGGGIQRGGRGALEAIPIVIPEGGGTVSITIDPAEMARLLQR